MELRVKEGIPSVKEDVLVCQVIPPDGWRLRYPATPGSSDEKRLCVRNVPGKKTYDLLNIDQETLEALGTVLNRVGGPPKETRRGLIDKINTLIRPYVLPDGTDRSYVDPEASLICFVK